MTKLDPNAPMCACGHTVTSHFLEGCFACAGPPCDTANDGATPVGPHQAALPTLPDGWDWLQISIPVDRTQPVVPKDYAETAYAAAIQKLSDR